MADWRDVVGFGVDQFGEVWGYTHPADRITPVMGGGVVVGSTYYPPAVAQSSFSTLAIVAVVGLAAVYLLKK